MFERYTEKARRVLFFARYEAGELGGLAIEPHHLLLGLIREDPEMMSRVCNMSYPIDEIRDRMRTIVQPAEKLSPSADMPVSRQTKEALSYAAEEADRLNSRHIRTEHLLLGVLRAEGSAAAEMLAEEGVVLDLVRSKLSADETDKIGELRQLAAEARNLATAIARKADRIDAICDQLAGDRPPDNSEGTQ
jgi:ATP-dependent Clp protease ATP-binding subunit ClpC